MTAIINGDSPSITFSDATTQATSAVVSGKVPYSILPAGSVLQVVNATTTTEVTTSSGTYSDTNITASITPKYSTSKILTIVSAPGEKYGGSGGGPAFNLQLLRGATVISQFALLGGYTADTANNVNGNSVTYLDSPATTSSTTYKVQISNGTSGNGGTVGCPAVSAMGTITLMEIAQ